MKMEDLHFFGTLRQANVFRQKEWDTGGKIDLSYAGNEFAGEVSEAIAEAVLLITNPCEDNVADLANELGDVIICIDLIAIRAGIEADGPADVSQLEHLHPQMWVNELAADLQQVCNTIKKLERERHGMPGSRATLADLEAGLRLVEFDTRAIAECFAIDLDAVVARKFNATSEKVGLRTRMSIN